MSRKLIERAQTIGFILDHLEYFAWYFSTNPNFSKCIATASISEEINAWYAEKRAAKRFYGDRRGVGLTQPGQLTILFTDKEIETAYGKIDRAQVLSLFSAIDERGFILFLEKLPAEVLNVSWRLNSCYPRLKEERELLQMLSNEWKVAVTAEFLATQVHNKKISYEAINTGLAAECKRYQSYLNDRLDDLASSYVGLSVNTSEQGSKSIVTETGVVIPQKILQKAQQIIRKYNKLVELTSILEGDRTSEEKFNLFKDNYSSSQTHELLRANTDNYWSIFFKNVGYLLYSAITFGKRPGMKPRSYNVMSVWHTPEQTGVAKIDRMTRMSGAISQPCGR
jgi:hypothetical protein